MLYKRDSEAVCAILPADHIIRNQKAFLRTLNQSFDLAEEGHLVTMGVVPTRPDTGYGYLKTKVIQGRDKDILKVEKFVEKPKLALAKRYVKTKQYFWNSGMFVWRTETILNKFKIHAPDIYQGVVIQKSLRAWKKLPSISVDYAILEKDQDVVAVVVRDIEWSDVGSWDSLSEILLKKKDKFGNCIKGDVVLHNSKNNFIYSKSRVVACIDVEGIIVVDTEDALLICSKNSSQNVKVLVETLKKEKRKEWV